MFNLLNCKVEWHVLVNGRLLVLIKCYWIECCNVIPIGSRWKVKHQKFELKKGIAFTDLQSLLGKDIFVILL